MSTHRYTPRKPAQHFKLIVFIIRLSFSVSSLFVLILNAFDNKHLLLFEQVCFYVGVDSAALNMKFPLAGLENIKKKKNYTEKNVSFQSFVKQVQKDEYYLKYLKSLV